MKCYRQPPSACRLNSDNFWASSSQLPWIQFDVVFEDTQINGILTQGAGSVPQWVTKLQIKKGNDEMSLEPIVESASMRSKVSKTRCTTSAGLLET